MNRREVIEQFIPHSPLVGHLGMRLESIGTDEAMLVLPFRPELATLGRHRPRRRDRDA